MPVVRINAEKDARCTQSVVQLQGDTRTTMVRFIVNRYDGGVDLAGLVWLIKTTNAAGVPDAWEPEMVENAGEKIVIDWLIQGSVNDADGLTEYELNGLGYEADGKAIKWVGGKGTVSVRKSYHPTFGDDADGFSNLEKLIIYVNGELQDTVAAVERAEAAATAAAAASADSIWTSKPQGLSFGQQLQAQENIGLLEVVKNLTEPVEAEGNPVRMGNLVGGLPFDSVVTVLEPKQAGDGEAAPDNIRSISGWTGTKLQISNKETSAEYSADFGQTVYGGRLDWQKGVLKADRAIVVFNGTEAAWVRHDASGLMYINAFSNPELPVQGQGSPYGVCSHFRRTTANSYLDMGDGEFATGLHQFSSVTAYAIFKDATNGASVDAWKAYLAAQATAGTPVQVVYKLAAPVEIPLTPQEIKQLEGTNTLYGDGLMQIAGRMDGDVLGVVPEGVYELIETITLTEDGLLTRTAEPDGTPYKFNAAYVEITSALENSNGFNVYFEFENGKTHPLWVDKYTGNTVLSKKYAYLEVAKQYGLYHARYRPHTTNNYITTLQESVIADASGGIRAVNVTNVASAGTTFNIWGVRANA